MQTVLAVWLAVFLPGLAMAGGEEVAVVYNTALPESKQVAEYYARARQIPMNQVFGFMLSTGLDMSRTEFKAILQRPLADDLAERKLWKMGTMKVPAANGNPAHEEKKVVSSKIRYLVLCYGVPLRVSEDGALHESGQDKVQPEFRPNTASVDSELAWLPRIHEDLQLFGPMRNWVYWCTNRAAMSPTNGVLLVARLDGPTARIACGLVDKAIAAEHDGLWGRAYFDARGLAKTNVYYYGDELIYGSARDAAELGFDIVVDTNADTFSASFPLSQIGIYCGWYDWDASGPFTLPQVEFMPGAFAYHLHSFSASDIRSLTRNWVGPLLAKGAACTMGCVNEPYLQFTPNVDLFLKAWSHGWTFGEAAWTAQPALSWQTTVVGDPLYRPYGRTPLELHRDLAERKSPWLEWSYLRLMNLDRVHGAPVDQLVRTLENLDATRHSAILSEKLADLVAEEGKPSSAIDYYQRALLLDPSPQQRIRLRLTLGARLTDQSRLSEAEDDYQQLLKEVPDYPGKATVQALLAGLEQKGAVSASRGKS